MYNIVFSAEESCVNFDTRAPQATDCHCDIGISCSLIKVNTIIL